jgi:hypothetical protein
LHGIQDGASGDKSDEISELQQLTLTGLICEVQRSGSSLEDFTHRDHLVFRTEPMIIRFTLAFRAWRLSTIRMARQR